MIIAEIGSIHDGSFGNAKKIIKLASECGANAVKFQTHISSAETIKDAPSPKYFNEEPRFEYFNRTSFKTSEWSELKDIADELNLLFLSSPFSIESVEILESINISSYKIPSGEVTNLPLLEKIASLGKPVLLSSGMSNWDELDIAVEIFKKKCDLTVMQCSSLYPCPSNQVGLNVLNEISDRYKTKVGFSDHTIGFGAPIAAAALGAKVIEKHFTFSKHMYGSDAKYSMEPLEFKLMSEAINEVWDINKNPVNKNNIEIYKDMKNVFQKSIVSSTSIKKNTKLEMKHIAFKKPGKGIPASFYKDVIGKKILIDCLPDQFLKKEWLE